MEQVLKISRPLFCDSNAFGNLSDKNKFNDFCEKISKSNSLSAKELLIAFQRRNWVKEPITSLETLGIDQKQIFIDLEIKIKFIFPEIKNILKPFINEFAKRNNDSDGYIALSPGFDIVVDIMYDNFLSILNSDERLSYINFLDAIDYQEKHIKYPSALFLDYYNYIKDSDFDEIKSSIIRNLSIEAIFSFGGKIIGDLYSGDKPLKKLWCNYVSNFCIHLKNTKLNISGYRSINTTMDLLNRKLEPKFHQVDLLRPYNDLLDSYLIHWTTFGWFNYQGNLSSILGLTNDPYKVVIARIKQYQIYLAYEQNPIKAHNYENTPIFFAPTPGAIYVIDDEKKYLKYINILPSICHINDNQANIKFNLEEETIPI